MSAKEDTRTRWARMVLKSDLTPKARHVAHVLALHADWDTLGDMRPSQRTLATETGLHVASVVRALNELVDKGWLVKVRRGGPGRIGRPGGKGRCTLYRGTFPKRVTGDDAIASSGDAMS